MIYKQMLNLGRKYYLIVKFSKQVKRSHSLSMSIAVWDDFR